MVAELYACSLSDTFQMIVAGFIVIAIVGTVVSAVMLWRSSHHSRARQMS